ncbi:MAG: baseplate assembly protein, partial [Rhodospirillaceae bacterium]
VSSHTAIDLPSLSPPDSVETLDFETILAAMVADYQILQPDWDATVESDPVLKVLEVCAQREVVLRQQANDRVKAVLLAFASGTDLDHYAAGFGVERQIVTPADDSTSPPTPAVYESDARLRQRTQLALEGFTTAGPVGAYVFHAMSASPTVKDVDVSSPTPGVVLVVVLSTEGDGVPDAQLIN